MFFFYRYDQLIYIYICIYKKRRQNIIPKYTGKYTLAAQWLTQKGRGGETKNITYPHLEPSQSIKLTREIGLISINALDQDHKLYTKELFTLWIEIVVLSNTNKFLSFHTVQKIHRGATFQAFLWALTTKEPCHLSNVSLTEKERA